MKYEYADSSSRYTKQAASYFMENSLGEIGENAIVYLCRQSDRILGMAVLEMNPLHPHAFHLKLHVSEPHRRKGIGSRLINDLSRDQAKAFRVGVDSADHQGIRFLESQGFLLTVRCSLPEYRREDLKEIAHAPSREILPFTELEPSQMEAARKLLYENYARNHFYNPLGDAVDHAGFASAAMEGYAPEDSYAIVENEETAGYLIAYRIDSKAVEVGYVGKSPAFHGNMDASFFAILKKLFGKYETVSFEIDDVDTQGMEVLALFKKQPAASWNVYFKNNRK